MGMGWQVVRLLMRALGAKPAPKREWRDRDEMLDRFILNNDTSIEQSDKLIPVHRANGNFEYEARNANSGAEACIEKVCFLMRGRSTCDGVPETIRAGLRFARIAVDAVRRAESDRSTEGAWVHSLNLKFPLLAAALARDWALADELAAALLSPVLRHDHEEAPLLGAVFRDDPSFAEQLPGFSAFCRKSKFYRKYYGYTPMMTAILARDSEAFSTALIAAEQTFRQRGDDRELGVPGYHDAMFDYLAVALRNLAERRGLKVEHASEIVPRLPV